MHENDRIPDIKNQRTLAYLILGSQDSIPDRICHLKPKPSGDQPCICSGE
jgi:hypothetical protein